TLGVAVENEPAVLENEGARAQRLDRPGVVADEEDGPSGARDLAHFSETLPLERNVADCQDLVDDEDVRLEVCSDREGEADVHTARIALHRRVDELLDLRE